MQRGKVKIQEEVFEIEDICCELEQLFLLHFEDKKLDWKFS